MTGRERHNKGINRSAQKRGSARCWVPAPLRVAVPGYAQR
jgi:hypothetical protein